MRTTVKPKKLRGDALKIAAGKMRAKHLGAVMAQWEVGEADGPVQLELFPGGQHAAPGVETDRNLQRAEAAVSLARDIAALKSDANAVPF